MTCKVAVLAGTRVQFIEWKRQNRDVNAVFCDKWPMFAGIEFSRMVEIGTFNLRDDARVIRQQVGPMVRCLHKS